MCPINETLTNGAAEIEATDTEDINFIFPSSTLISCGLNDQPGGVWFPFAQASVKRELTKLSRRR